MTEGEFFNSISKKKTAIKTLLLDQGFISGIGNWVADEVLYQARIHPSQIASSLSKVESARLLKSIKEVLEKAVEVGADNSQYPSSWIFHSRDKKPGKAFVDGKKIDFITVGGRTTAYVPELQKLNGVQATKAPAKPRKQASKKNKIDDHNSDNDDGNDGVSSDEEMEDVKAKQTKNSKSGKSTKNDDDESEKKTAQTRNGRATAKRKSEDTEESKDANKSKKSRSGEKKATTGLKSRKGSVSNVNDDGGNNSEDLKIAVKGEAKKTQQHTKKKAK